MSNIQETIKIDVRPEKIEREIRELVAAYGNDFVIRNETEMLAASDALIRLRGKLREINEERTGWVKPLQDTVKRINEGAKKITAPLESALTVLGDALLRFRSIQAAKIEKKNDAALEKATASEIRKGIVPTIEQEKSVGTMAGQLVFQKVWDFEVVDLVRVPSKFLAVDSAAIRASIRTGERDIPGLRIFQREIPQARRERSLN